MDGWRGGPLLKLVGVEVYVTVDFSVRFTRLGSDMRIELRCAGGESSSRRVTGGRGAERALLPSENRTTFHKCLGITPDWPCGLV